MPPRNKAKPLDPTESIAKGRTSFDKSAKADLSSKDATQEDCEIQQ